MALPRFEIIDDQPPQGYGSASIPPSQPQGHDAAFSALMLALKTLSQKTVIALSRLASLAMIGSVFWLFMSIPNPVPNQIIWGGMYAVFILTAIFFMVRRQS